MNKLQTALKYFPYVLGGVVAVEAAVPTGTSGATKKNILLGSVIAATKVGEAVPEAHVQMISGLIDTVVSSMNQAGIFGHTTVPASK